MKDLREFLEKAKAQNDLKQIDGVDYDLELGVIAELMAEKQGPALLFDNIKDYPQGYRVATNIVNIKRRVAIAMGLPADTPGIELVKRWRQKDFTPIKPAEVKTGPVMENVITGNDVNILKFPAPRWHEHDGGRYMGTAHLAITKDPDEGYINFGVERMMVHDEKTLGLYISPGKHNRIIAEKYWSRGEICPVVIAFSPDPITFMTSTLHVPWGISEYDWAGWMKKEPVEIIKGEITGLPFPAYDEIVIEGEYLPELRDEGPLGEWTGYYAGDVAPAPIVKVKAVYHRNNPILAGVLIMQPPLGQLGVPVMSAPVVWDDLERAGVTGVKGVWQLESGGGRLLMVISIKQDHAGHAKQAAMVAAGGHGGGYMGRYVIVVDDDIDPTDINDVMWAVATRCEPENSIDIIRECWGTRLDSLLPPEKREKKDYSHSIAILNACRPFSWKDEFPKAVKSSAGLRKKVIDKWGGKLELL
ncbi:UbiD family decarboxylase [Chloroflexota bacterium]